MPEFTARTFAERVREIVQNEESKGLSNRTIRQLYRDALDQAVEEAEAREEHTCVGHPQACQRGNCNICDERHECEPVPQPTPREALKEAGAAEKEMEGRCDICLERVSRFKAHICNDRELEADPGGRP